MRPCNVHFRGPYCHECTEDAKAAKKHHKDFHSESKCELCAKCRYCEREKKMKIKKEKFEAIIAPSYEALSGHILEEAKRRMA